MAIYAGTSGYSYKEWKDAYVFFKHKDEGAGPKMAMRFQELAGA